MDTTTQQKAEQILIDLYVDAQKTKGRGRRALVEQRLGDLRRYRLMILKNRGE